MYERKILEVKLHNITKQANRFFFVGTDCSLASAFSSDSKFLTTI